ncbi:MAG: glycosyltransferase family 2 protein [Anaerolineales bacterium]|nr:glycosyltransferase family 2 protein [Anaerolineales bacterium]
MMSNFPVDPMFEQPDGWLRVSLPKIEAATGAITKLTGQRMSLPTFDEARVIFQRKNWVKLTNVKPANSHFSIIVPVHNEERTLPSFLGALFASELPSDADIQVVFVLNATTDRSSEIIRNRLGFINHPEEVILSESTCDPRRANVGYRFHQDRIRFLVIETPSAGKANALNLGNEIARREAHEVAINIDANNWVEPDSIALMYGKAKQTILDVPLSNVVLVNAREYCPTRNTQIKVSVKIKTQKAEVSGCMFAWSTKWINENNGFPQHAIEDYGAGLLALSQKKRIVESDANIWVYSASNSFDENRQVIRFIYGAMQLARRFEKDAIALQILREDFPHLRPLRSRLEYYLFRRGKKRHFMDILRGVIRWMFNEILIYNARRKFRKDPDGQTWDPIGSTK